MHDQTLEYILFDQRWADEFLQFLNQHQIPATQKAEGDGISIFVPDDLSDELDTLLEAEYDRIMAAHEAEDTGVDNMNRVGIQYQNAAGETCQARIDMDFINRLMEVISIEELQSFVQQLADEIEAGGKKRLCER